MRHFTSSGGVAVWFSPPRLDMNSGEDERFWVLNMTLKHGDAISEVRSGQEALFDEAVADVAMYSTASVRRPCPGG